MISPEVVDLALSRGDSTTPEIIIKYINQMTQRWLKAPSYMQSQMARSILVSINSRTHVFAFPPDDVIVPGDTSSSLVNTVYYYITQSCFNIASRYGVKPENQIRICYWVSYWWFEVLFLCLFGGFVAYLTLVIDTAYFHDARQHAMQNRVLDFFNGILGQNKTTLRERDADILAKREGGKR